MTLQPDPDEAFEPVAHDLRTCGLPCHLKYAAPSGEPPERWRQLAVARVRVGYLDFPPDLTPAARTRALAFHTQAAILENLQLLPLDRPWPMCKDGHPHPMDLAWAGGDEWPHWRCPATDVYRWPVGEHPGVT